MPGQRLTKNQIRLILWTGTATFVVVAPLIARAYLQPRLVLYSHSEAQLARKILFVGNSLTYYNDMPNLVKALIEQEEPEEGTKIAMLTGPGASLREHHDNDLLARVLENEGPWDWVVLQEKSSLALISPDEVHETTSGLAKRIRRYGARPIIYVDWSNPSMAHVGKNGYHAIARELRIDVIPITDIWHSLRKQFPDLELLNQDKIHPNRLGSYVVAYICASRFLETSLNHLPSNSQIMSTASPPRNDAESVARFSQFLKTLKHETSLVVSAARGF